MTKAGTETKREEIEGYEYCSTLPGNAILNLIKGRIEESVIWSGDENLKEGSINDGTWKEGDDWIERVHYSIWDENLSGLRLTLGVEDGQGALELLGGAGAGTGITNAPATTKTAS